MLEKSKHEIVLRQVLDKIYGSHKISNLLGFKGGTACYFFYDLPRFSTDLDFNLLNLDKKTEVFKELKSILVKFGTLKEEIIKKNTIFFLLMHTEGKSGIKIEVSTRKSEAVNKYDIREFYGKSLPLMKKEYIFSNKLIALTQRKTSTPRDLFDISYFFSKNWDIAKEPIEEIIGKSVKEYLGELPEFIINNFNKKTIHHGLGQLLDNKEQRDDVRESLIENSITKIRIWLDSVK